MATKQQKEAFIAKIAPIIQKEAAARGYKVASPIIAQACLESGYGQSGLAGHNNFFGLTCGDGWKGGSVTMATKEERNGRMYTRNAAFRSYATMEEGVKGYFDFIESGRYANLKGASSAREYLEMIKADGYATASNYVGANMDVVNGMGLMRYDDPEYADLSQDGQAYSYGGGGASPAGQAPGGLGGIFSRLMQAVSSLMGGLFPGMAGAQAQGQALQAEQAAPAAQVQEAQASRPQQAARASGARDAGAGEPDRADVPTKKIREVAPEEEKKGPQGEPSHTGKDKTVKESRAVSESTAARAADGKDAGGRDDAADKEAEEAKEAEAADAPETEAEAENGNAQEGRPRTEELKADVSNEAERAKGIEDRARAVALVACAVRVARLRGLAPGDAADALEGSGFEDEPEVMDETGMEHGGDVKYKGKAQSRHGSLNGQIRSAGHGGKEDREDDMKEDAAGRGGEKAGGTEAGRQAEEPDLGDSR